MGQNVRLFLNRRIRGIRVCTIANCTITVLILSLPFIYFLCSGGFPVNDPVRKDNLVNLVWGCMLAAGFLQVTLTSLADDPEAHIQRDESGTIVGAHGLSIQEIGTISATLVIALVAFFCTPAAKFNGLPFGFFSAVGVAMIGTFLIQWLRIRQK